MLPCIYSLGLEGHMYASPPQRRIGWDYETDPEVWSKALENGEEQFWFGDNILLGGIYEPTVTTARIHLPMKKNDALFRVI